MPQVTARSAQVNNLEFSKCLSGNENFFCVVLLVTWVMALVLTSELFTKQEPCRLK